MFKPLNSNTQRHALLSRRRQVFSPGGFFFTKLVLFRIFIETIDTFPDRLAAGRKTLNLETGVRIPVREHGIFCI